jgi:hypothetical protein
MSVFSDLSNSVITAVTGSNPAEVRANLDAAQQQVTLAVETMIALQVIVVFELFLLVVIAFKERS